MGDPPSSNGRASVSPEGSVESPPSIRGGDSASVNDSAMTNSITRATSSALSGSGSGHDLFIMDRTSSGGSGLELGALGGDLGGLVGDDIGRGRPSQLTLGGIPIDDKRMDSGASSPLLQTEALPDEDGTLCPYCHKDFRKPRVLDCLHSMCEDCIIAQLDGRREADKERRPASLAPSREASTTDCMLEDRPHRSQRPTPPGVIRCPVCAQESHVGNDIRFVHTMLIDYVRVNEVEEARGERSCRSCKTEQTAVAFCRQCGNDLCANCLQAHRDMRMFDNHEVLSYAELEASGRAGDTRRVLCSTHGQPYLLLCATCEALACRQCLDFDHNQHKMVDVNPIVVQAISKELVDLSNRVKNKWCEWLDGWRSIPDRSASLHLQFEDAKGRIELAYEEAMKLLEESKAKKLVELEEARDRQEATVDDLYRKVDSTQTKVDDAVRFTSRLVGSANGVELLASRKKVIHQLRSLEHTMPTLGTEIELQFIPTDKKKLESAFTNAVGLVLCRSVPTAPSSGAEPTNRVSVSDSEWSNTTSASSAHNGHHQHSAATTPIGAPSTVTVPSMPNGARMSASMAAMTLAPIGGERAAKKAQGSTAATSKFPGGWPPSSNPPELPSPSPPKDLQAAAVAVAAQQQAVAAHQQAALNAAAAAVVTPTSLAQTPSGAAYPPPWAALAASGASANADPRIAAAAAAIAAGGYPPGSAANSAAIASQIKLATLIMQQQNNVLGLQQLQRMGMALPPSASSTVDAHIRMLAAHAANANNAQAEAAIFSAVANAAAPRPELAKGTHEIKLAFAHGTGSAGSTLRELHSPGGFAVADNDDILIADTNNHRIVVITPVQTWKFGRAGQEDGQLCFPRRVVAMKGEQTRYVVIDKAIDNKSRAQLFSATGDYIRRINLSAVVPKGGIEVWAATSTPTGHLVMVDQSSVIYTLDIKDTQPRVVNWVDASNHLLEASDVAVHDKHIYVTDFKGHCVHVFTMDGSYVRKIGEPSHTPFPIGIDVTRGGEVYVGHTHGNKLTIVVYGPDGGPVIQQLINMDFRMSRCASLRVTSTGNLVTLSKHAHTLYGFRRASSLRP